MREVAGVSVATLIVTMSVTGFGVAPHLGVLREAVTNNRSAPRDCVLRWLTTGLILASILGVVAWLAAIPAARVFGGREVVATSS